MVLTFLRLHPSVGFFPPRIFFCHDPDFDYLVIIAHQTNQDDIKKAGSPTLPSPDTRHQTQNPLPHSFFVQGGKCFKSPELISQIGRAHV